MKNKYIAKWKPQTRQHQRAKPVQKQHKQVEPVLGFSLFTIKQKRKQVFPTAQLDIEPIE